MKDLSVTSSTSAPPPEAKSSTNKLPEVASSKATFWGVFVSTFITIFLAELGDKTQVATLLISAESHKPLTVFVGAALALISTSLVGVLVGQWLARRVSPDILDTLAGILLLIISVGLVADVIGL
ncbi:TMEM165/GDT1 family protein [Leptothoe spongobia]|uniref:GDT1 family protein n=1 Tax=Leptothoe spongobia TAU-MAC 1115 TaxID=1967444 RepID=A0A947GGM7_9CYAN|nr:TMEM165/GDT1 family protein [Leptothoe spongobia]MBT9314965.1 TMEM165/GDT1 family protein [Leptothoe spongobia TAU-MAC 1115]